MSRLVFVAFLVTCASASSYAKPGGLFSVSESLLKRPFKALVPTIVSELNKIQIPGMNRTHFEFGPIRVQDVSIHSYDISVEPEGIELVLADMQSEIAPTDFCIHAFQATCCGQIWTTVTGASYSQTFTVSPTEDGGAQLTTTTSKFTVGKIALHHKMYNLGCKIAADYIGLVDAAVIGIWKFGLSKIYPRVIARVVDKVGDGVLGIVASPVPFGPFRLDNSLVAMGYSNGRITYKSKSEFKSFAHPQESLLVPPSLSVVGDRDVDLCFSDYVINTLFDSFYAEQVGDFEFKLPFIHTRLSDKVCPKCPVVINTTLTEPARAVFVNGSASYTVNNLNFTLGVQDKNKTGPVIPLVILSVNATASGQWSFHDKESKSVILKLKLSLDSFDQALLVSFIGKEVDISALTGNVRDAITAMLDKFNAANPGLPIPSILGVKLAHPSFVVDERLLQVSYDLVVADSLPVAIIV